MKLRSFVILIMCGAIQMVAQTTYGDGIIRPVNNPSHPAPRYAYVREADIMWAKRIWRVIDFREKINQYFMFPLTQNNQRINLIELLQQGIRDGEIVPFDPFQGDDFKLVMTKDEALNIGTSVDSFEVISPNPPYDPIGWKTERTSLDPFRVRKLKVKEDWFFDRKRSVMEVRIVGICPVLEVVDVSTGEVRGTQDMYWINFEQARNYLATYRVYSPYNYGSTISYDDAFIKRFFSSLIYKEDNTHDRRIAEYMQGMDALYEAEGIKDKLMLFEHDVWEQ